MTRDVWACRLDNRAERLSRNRDREPVYLYRVSVRNLQNGEFVGTSYTYSNRYIGPGYHTARDNGVLEILLAGNQPERATLAQPRAWTTPRPKHLGNGDATFTRNELATATGGLTTLSSGMVEPGTISGMAEPGTKLTPQPLPPPQPRKILLDKASNRLARTGTYWLCGPYPEALDCLPKWEKALTDFVSATGVGKRGPGGMDDEVRRITRVGEISTGG